MIPSISMSLLIELRARAKQIVVPVLGIVAVSYFSYHTIQGERGILAWLQLTNQLEQAKETLHTLEFERNTLASRVRLLHPDHLDLDMLDEQARRLLNVGREDEILFLLPSAKAEAGQPASLPTQKD